MLGGCPVASLRVSEADPRPRHRGVSHHSLTSYGRVAVARADVAVPELPGEFGKQVAAEAAPLGERHRLVTVNPGIQNGIHFITLQLEGGGITRTVDLVVQVG